MLLYTITACINLLLVLIICYRSIDRGNLMIMCQMLNSSAIVVCTSAVVSIFITFRPTAVINRKLLFV